ncbi:MAG: ferritin-like domain-containing protein [Janthinobacterium lividum]
MKQRTSPQATEHQPKPRAKRRNIARKLAGGALIALGAAYLLRGKKSPAGSQADTLSELLLFVNDRIEGYQRAAAESHDDELRSYYQDRISQSQQFAITLNGYLAREGGEPETGTTLKGKLYRQWMDAKALLTDRDEQAILASNRYGEEWAIAAYEDALEGTKLTGDVRAAVESQHAQAQQTYERLKQLSAQQK